MKCRFDLKIVMVAIVMLVGLMGLMMPTNPVQAQGSPKPTPTNVPSGGGGGEPENNEHSDDRNDHRHQEADNQPNNVSGAVLSGVVFNYSSKSPQSGVVVRLQGNGWQGETTTDMNGFYQFAGLSYGQGTLKAQLPPGAFAVTPDWEVKLIPGQSQTVNLGYYLGETSPLPVRVTSRITGQVLFIEIVNTLNEAVTNGRLEVRLPSGTEALPKIKSSLGTVMYGVTTQRVQLDSLAGGTKVQIEVPFHGAAQSQGPAAVIPAAYYSGEAMPPVFRVSFTYDQQVTPQLLILTANGTFLNRIAGAVQTQTVTNTMSITTPVTTTAVMTTAVPITAATTPMTRTQPISQPPTFMPTTGYSSSYFNAAPVLTGLLFGVGLVIAGWWSLRTKRSRFFYN